MSTDNQAEQIEAGNQAEELLRTKAFGTTIDELVQATFNYFVNSKAEDTEGRERAYNHYQAINDIVATLQQRVQVRDNINEADAQDEDNDNNEANIKQ